MAQGQERPAHNVMELKNPKAGGAGISDTEAVNNVQGATPVTCFGVASLATSAVIPRTLCVANVERLDT